jgi:hypothetical protein
MTTIRFAGVLGILFDGSNVWITSSLPTNRLLKLDSSGNVLEAVALDGYPLLPMFDGANIWVPLEGSFPSRALDVVAVATGKRVAWLQDGGLDLPFQAAFDGRRILVASLTGVTLWDPATLTPVKSLVYPNGLAPQGVCSDGVNFWVVLTGTEQLARF